MVFEVLLWYFPKASASAVAAARVGYVPVAEVEKTVDLQR
jgi:hypothetical protein